MLHSILAVANLFANNNISQISYCDPISSQSTAVNCIFSEKLHGNMGGNIYFAGDGTRDEVSTKASYEPSNSTTRNKNIIYKKKYLCSFDS